MSKSIIVVLAVAIVIAVGGYLFPQASQSPLFRPGAVASLDGVDVPYISIGGVRTFYYNQNINATSSFVCVLRNPFQATSSIDALSIDVDANGIAVANALYISTSTSEYGTSTVALVSAFPMGVGQFSLDFAGNSATSTATGPGGTNDTTLLPGRLPSGASNYILGPSEYVTFKIATTTGGTFSSYLTGTCKGQIRAL